MAIKGSQSQPLHAAVTHERRFLEERHSSLVKEMGQRAKLLRNLTNSAGGGDMLEDHWLLILALEETKKKPVEIGAKITQAQSTSRLK